MTFSGDEAKKWTGRVITAKDGLVYTVTSCSTLGMVHVYDPRTNEYLVFDTRETFENWMYGTPVPCAAIRKEVEG